MRYRYFLALVIGFVGYVAAASAQDGAEDLVDRPAPETNPAPASEGSAPAAPAVATVDTRPVRVVSVEPAEARLGESITLTVENLAAAIAEAHGECESLVLFLDGNAIAGLPPSRCDPDPTSEHVGFVLRRTADNEESWRQLLGHPTAFDKEVQVTIGSSNSRTFPRKNNDVPLRLTQIPTKPFVFFLVIAAGTTLLLGLLGRRTGLLREPGGDPSR